MSTLRSIVKGMALICILGLAGSNTIHAQAPIARQVIVPGEDRFAPFAITIRAGQSVQWVNLDTDDHTVVSNNFFNPAFQTPLSLRCASVARDR